MADPKNTANTPPNETQNKTGVEKPTHKIRISLPPGVGKIFYNDETNVLLSPLKLTQGFLFPIQPAVSVGYDAKYQELTPTHSNFPYQMYQSSSMKAISLTGDFVIRNQYDAQYVNAGMHFLKSLTRMFNFRDGEYAGAPPHVVRLHGMGFTAFDNLPCVLTDVTINYPESVDHITFQINNKSLFKNETARMPVFLTISVSLTPVFSRDFITNVYTTTAFSTGSVRLMGPKEQTQRTQAATQDSNNASANTNTIGAANKNNALTNALKGITLPSLPTTKITNSPISKVDLSLAGRNNTIQQPNVFSRGLTTVGSSK